MRISSLIVFAILCLFLNIAKSQSTAILDSKNGFGELRFDKPIDELKIAASLKKVTGSTKTREEVYIVKNLENFTVYGYLPAYINLWFYEKKLYKIEVKLRDGHDYGEVRGINRAVYLKVLDTYGSYSNWDTTNTTRMVQHKDNMFWYGKSVSLVKSHDYSENIHLDRNNLPIYIGDIWYFISNDVYNKMLNDLGLNKGL